MASDFKITGGVWDNLISLMPSEIKTKWPKQINRLPRRFGLQSKFGWKVLHTYFENNYNAGFIVNNFVGWFGSCSFKLPLSQLQDHFHGALLLLNNLVDLRTCCCDLSPDKPTYWSSYTCTCAVIKRVIMDICIARLYLEDHKKTTKLWCEILTRAYSEP